MYLLLPAEHSAEVDGIRHVENMTHAFVFFEVFPTSCSLLSSHRYAFCQALPDHPLAGWRHSTARLLAMAELALLEVTSNPATL